MMGAASRLSSHVLCITIVCRPPMKIWRARAARLSNARGRTPRPAQTIPTT